MSDPAPVRRPRLLVLALLLVVALATAWVVLAAQTRGGVSVVPQSLTCGKTPVRLAIPPEDDIAAELVPRPAFELSAGPGTHCNLTVVIANTGSRSVHVRSIAFPALTPTRTSGHLVMVSRYLDADRAPTEDEESGGAVFAIDQDVPSHEASRFQFRLEHRPWTSSCHDRSYSEGHTGLPVVTTSALGIPGSTSGTVNIVVHGVGDAGDNCS